MEKPRANQGAIQARAFLGTIIILGILMILACLATHYIPAGSLVDEEYKRLEQTPVPFWKVPLAPLLLLGSKDGGRIAGLILFILFIGGSFSILNKSGVLPSLLGRFVEKYADRKKAFLAIGVFLFSLLGSTLGILEEIVPMVLLLIPIAYRMGWDSVTGLAIPFASAGCGFAAATFNPFTVGFAQRLAGLPLFSGLSLRVPFFIVTTSLVIVYLLWYTSRLSKKTAGRDTESAEPGRPNGAPPAEVLPTIERMHAVTLFILVCFLAIGGVVIGGATLPALQQASFPIIALIFMCMGFGAALIAGCGIRPILRHFARGVADFSPAIILVLMAASVGYMIRSGNVMDTILHGAAGWIRGLNFGAGGNAVLFYFFQMLMNLLVPGGAGQAALTIPVLAPLGDLVGLSRQTVVLAFQCGDGFSNLLWPTNPVLIIALGLAGVGYKDWLKWVLPLQAGLLVISVLFLLLAVAVGYQ